MSGRPSVAPGRAGTWAAVAAVDVEAADGARALAELEHAGVALA